MAVNGEKVCEFLFNSPGSTVNSIKKNTGITKVSEINQILITLDKEGSVFKLSSSNPVKWSLTDKKRERMLTKKRANEIHEKEEELEPVVKIEQTVEPMSVSVENGQQKESDVKIENSPVPVAHTKEEDNVESNTETTDEPPRKRPKAMDFDDYENGKWALDDIPDEINIDAAIQSVGGGYVNDASKEGMKLEKLKSCLEKNPVSGLLEFAQFYSETCELVVLEQSGPSHDPRFKVQAVLGSRQFPVVQACNKKIARKDAADMALRILMREEQGGTQEEVLSEMAEAPASEKDEVPVLPQTTSQGGKNPISILMEHGQKSGNVCEFVMVSQEGPPHDPKFTYAVKIGERTFPSVVANNKKIARQLSAEAAVKELLGESAVQSDKVDPVSNVISSESSMVLELSLNNIKAAQTSGVGDLLKYLNANPVSGLLEYARAKGFAAEFTMVNQTGPPHDPKFVFQAKVGGRYFPAVSASNKKQAKAEAADAALRVLIGEAEKATNSGDNITELPVSGSTFHDQIAMLSHQKFNCLTAKIQNSLLGRKILAAIVMKKNSEDQGTVVSIGTGNRCVKGEELSLKGETVNDCHAEIIARRGFLRFLYSELLKYNPDLPEESIFEESEGDLMRVRPSVTFHLYISTAPCGDGALFDKSCSDQPCLDGDKKHNPTFENPKQGKLRTKVENGEGTIPVESSDIVPTWDGIQHGERLRTMSCSDKILRWNVLGLQGAILSHFLEPVYLGSVTLGYLFSQGHLTRAICCRMCREGNKFEELLQEPYIVNHPEVGRVSVYDSTRQTGKTKESSVNWCLADEEVEVLDGTKGKVDGPKLEVSRLSKMHIFRLFQQLSRNHKGKDELTGSYSEVKEAATDYQKNKEQFIKALQEMGYGNWISKPQEEKTFCVA
ncbi:double-stranded RNA-specific adenosine deaminase isoform X2 [Bombina bombina]|nr:double-stranded RNA-specific adenosine deaminase isoform X2 [Bombina bombina]XP_053560441.1 double-stranded RNA-specific adenosine deaminase isoform X2 [Bombina bombina]